MIALASVGVAQATETGVQRMVESLTRAQQAGIAEHTARAYVFLAGASVGARRQPDAMRYLDEGLAYCSDRGLELFRLYLLASRARLELDQGRWTDATDTAASILRTPRTSTTPRIHALVLGLVRTRRGDPEWLPVLDEAWALAEPTGELPRFGPVSAAEAEGSWLAGDPRGVEKATMCSGTLELARERGMAGFSASSLTCAGARASTTSRPTPSPSPTSFCSRASSNARRNGGARSVVPTRRRSRSSTPATRSCSGLRSTACSD